MSSKFKNAFIQNSSFGNQNFDPKSHLEPVSFPEKTQNTSLAVWLYNNHCNLDKGLLENLLFRGQLVLQDLKLPTKESHLSEDEQM